MPYKDPTSAAAKASMNAKTRRYRKNHPDRVAAWPSQSRDAKHDRYYRHEHGVSLEAFEAQIARQNNLCPIGNHPFGSRGKDGDSPCQDHDHESGQNRLILCRNHNVALGLFNDSIEDMQQAILYLQSFKKEKDTLK
jgi:hypothetical protein